LHVGRAEQELRLLVRDEDDVGRPCRSQHLLGVAPERRPVVDRERDRRPDIARPSTAAAVAAPQTTSEIPLTWRTASPCTNAEPASSGSSRLAAEPPRW
jgi:hypothetical protein